MESWQEPSEGAITASIMRYLKRIPDSFAWKIHGGTFGIGGLPDICFIHKGKVYFFEVKKPSGRLTKLQLEMLEKLAAAGASCNVVISKNEVQYIIERSSKK